MSFHYKDGWLFERATDDGDVHIYHLDLELDIMIDPASWASIVASVSKLGETAESYQHAIAAHQGDIS